MKPSMLALAALAAALASAPAQAADETNRKASRKPHAQALDFDRIDANKDGVIDRQEFEAARQSAGGKDRGERKEPRNRKDGQKSRDGGKGKPMKEGKNTGGNKRMGEKKGKDTAAPETPAPTPATAS